VANAVLALIEVEGLRELYRLRRSEFGVAAVCLASLLLLGTIAAVIIAFLLSVVDVVRRAATPATGVLGELPSHRGFLVIDEPANVETTPGLVVFRFAAQLFFANAETFHQQVVHLVESTRPTPRWFVLDAEAISDIDTTGADTLQHVLEYLHQQGVIFAITRVSEPVRQLLVRYDVLPRVGNDHVFETNPDALDAFQGEEARPTGPSIDATAG
jgi:MFS superfamily sulfate permease-like transporter